MENTSTAVNVSWESYRACADKDPAVFFPSGTKGLNAAKKICNTCVVKGECLDYALRNDETHGVWGGTSERERARLSGKNR